MDDDGHRHGVVGGAWLKIWRKVPGDSTTDPHVMIWIHAILGWIHERGEEGMDVLLRRAVTGWCSHSQVCIRSRGAVLKIWCSGTLSYCARVRWIIEKRRPPVGTWVEIQCRDVHSLRMGVGRVGGRVGGERTEREMGSKDIRTERLLNIGVVSNEGVWRVWVLLIGLETVVEEV